MRLLFVIDHFGSGGAQKQMVNLAKGLTLSGHEVNIFIYYPEYDFHRKTFSGYSIDIIDYYKKSRGISTGVFRNLRKILITGKYDAALAYLDTPAIYLLLCSIGLKIPVVVSDRSSYLGASSRFSYFLKRQFYRLADKVVANSETQRSWLVKSAGIKESDVTTIYNGYDPAEFENIECSTRSDRKSLLAIGGIRPVKNIENLILALELFIEKHKWVPDISWAGNSDSLTYENKVLKMLDDRPGVRAAWKWLGERDDIPDILAQHDALILPSYYEGLPNVVCEALFAGKPVLASDVCDNPVLVEDGTRGFLFDPQAPASVMEAMEKFFRLTDSELRTMCEGNRKFAHVNLTLDNMVARYVSLFGSLL